MAAYSSSSAPSSPCSYDVFLSFRGKDTRTTFTDHLYTALTQAGIHTFRDDDEIERGEDIQRELENAIQQSKVAVIVFSPDYASSRWCLDELVQINKRRKAGHTHILPIFYHMEPSELKWRKRSYGEAFAKHEERYKEQLVQQWKDVLQEVAALSGEILKEDQYEAIFIKNIVKLVLMKLDHKLLYEEPHLVGIDAYVNKINKWLKDESTDKRILIVHGIGGIGKTTIARNVYNQNNGKFEKCCFLQNVRETSKQSNGVHSLQEQILHDMGRSQKIYNTDEGVIKINDAACCRKVLIIFDDLDDSEQFKQVIGHPECLPLRSKIIITTRNMSLLNCHEGFWKLEICPLCDHDSFQLFNLHAFGGNSPPSHLFDYPKRAVECCGGLPLALTVLAASLSKKKIDVWKSAVEEISVFPDDKVLKVLRISYDSLENDRRQQLFLHIACFFIGKDRDEVVTILDGCGLHASTGIEHLIDRCLITNEWNKLTMHQLVRDMGREIVRQESDEPGKRSRIWNHQEAFDILTEGTGSENIKGFTLDLHMLNENCLEGSVPPCDSIPIEAEAFKEMRNLQLLQLNNVRHVRNIVNFPINLVWLCWPGFPLKYIPAARSHTRKLVVLNMPYSRLHHLFQESVPLPRLKILNLSDSYHLSTTPDFKVLPNLERLVLKNCRKLEKIDKSIGVLKRLVLLNLNGCINLRSLPSTIGNLKALQELYLGGCIELAKIDESIGFLERLVLLNLNGCIKLRSLPRTMGNLKALQELYLGGCKELGSFPREIVYMEKLKKLVEDGISLQELSTTEIDEREVNKHSALGLISRGATKLNQFLPSSLTALSLRYCNLSDDAFIGNLSLPFLEYLDLAGNVFRTLPDDMFKRFHSLYSLDLSECYDLIAVPEIPSELGELEMAGCGSLTKLADTSYHDGFSFDVLKEEDIYMIHSLKLFDKHMMRNFQLQMFSTTAYTFITSPVKALREHGIFSFFQQGSEIPRWYKYQEEGDAISFVLEDEIIYALNICVVYKNKNFSDDEEIPFLLESPTLMVKSKKVRNILYEPSFFAFEEEDWKYMLWLSCWNIHDVLSSGDEVEVSVDGGFEECQVEIKRIGVHPVVQRECDDCLPTLPFLLPPPLSHNFIH